MTDIRPQPGPQEQFLSTTADVAIYGGAAFGGKTFGILLDCARPLARNGFDAVIFRRNYPQIKQVGGLWDTSLEIYPKLGGEPKHGDLSWQWPSGHRVMFRHLQHEKTKEEWQGASIPLVCFDELTHFSRGQFVYIISRNRLSRGAKGRPYVRGTCNPAPDSWVYDLIAWWIDPDTGLPIPERSGVIRWFAMGDNDRFVWGDTEDELRAKGFDHPRSFTFIAAKITDNKIGMERDPSYLGNLKSLPMVEREKLLHGNWNARAVAGTVFKRSWFAGKILTACPPCSRWVRYWDRAATEKTNENPDPDWTAGVRVGLREDGLGFVVAHVVRIRETPAGVERAIAVSFDTDGDCEQTLEVDPGQAGIVERDYYAQKFAGRQIGFVRPSGNKMKRALPTSAQAEAGRIFLMQGPWNEAFISELESFCDWENLPKEMRPSTQPHDDQADGLSGAISRLTSQAIPRVRQL